MRSYSNRNELKRRCLMCRLNRSIKKKKKKSRVRKYLSIEHWVVVRNRSLQILFSSLWFRFHPALWVDNGTVHHKNRTLPWLPLILLLHRRHLSFKQNISLIKNIFGALIRVIDLRQYRVRPVCFAELGHFLIKIANFLSLLRNCFCLLSANSSSWPPTRAYCTIE